MVSVLLLDMMYDACVLKSYLTFMLIMVQHSATLGRSPLSLNYFSLLSHSPLVSFFLFFSSSRLLELFPPVLSWLNDQDVGAMTRGLR